jgi:hypothetical protein
MSRGSFVVISIWRSRPVLVHTVICAFYLWGGYFSASVPVFVGLFAGIWLGNLALLLLVRSGRTKAFRDPSLSLWLALWLTSGFLVSIYLLKPRSRAAYLVRYPRTVSASA